MKRSDPEQVGNLINRLISEYNLDKPAASNKACWAWDRVVGHGIAALTTRKKAENEVLHVWISSASLKNELMFQRAMLIKAINSEIGSDYIKELHIH